MVKSGSRPCCCFQAASALSRVCLTRGKPVIGCLRIAIQTKCLDVGKPPHIRRRSVDEANLAGMLLNFRDVMAVSPKWASGHTFPGLPRRHADDLIDAIIETGR